MEQGPKHEHVIETNICPEISKEDTSILQS